MSDTNVGAGMVPHRKNCRCDECEVERLRARLADEQAKRIAAEKQVETWFSRCEAHRIAKEACEAKIADLERRLSTVPEDFGPLIEALANAAENLGGRPTLGNSKRLTAACAALTEKIAALQFRLDASERERERGTAALREAFGAELWSLGHPAFVVVHLRDEYAKLERLWKEACVERDSLALRLDAAREALECLRPGLVLDLRYADPDDDHDALRSRIKTVTDALVAIGALDVRCGNANCNVLISAGEPHVEGCLAGVVEKPTTFDMASEIRKRLRGEWLCPHGVNVSQTMCSECDPLGAMGRV